MATKRVFFWPVNGKSDGRDEKNIQPLSDDERFQ